MWETLDKEHDSEILPDVSKLKNYSNLEAYLDQQEGIYGLHLALLDSTSILGIIYLDDSLRLNAQEAIQELRSLGIKRIGVLSGDSSERTQAFTRNLALDFYKAELKPEEKYQIIEEEKKNSRIIAMVGDGINDAPSLALADIGIAIGKNSTALTTKQADVVLLDDNLLNIGQAIKIGKRTIKKGKTNIALAIIFNTLGISLSILFFSHYTGAHYHAASWHIFQSILVVLNSVLLLDDPRSEKSLKAKKIAKNL